MYNIEQIFAKLHSIYQRLSFLSNQVKNFNNVNTIEDLSNINLTSPSSGQVLKFNGTSWINSIDNVGGSGGGGDMFVITYDSDVNGVVDNSEKLENQAGSYYLSRVNHTGTQLSSTISDLQSTVSSNTDVTANTAARHIHSNSVALGNVSGTNTGDETIARINTLYGYTPANSSSVNSHIGNTSNPHSVTKAQVGLGNVDDVSDVNKPVSAATQTALNLKQDTTSAVTLTGTQTITNKTISGSSNTISNIAQSSITGLVSSLSAKQDSLVSATNIKTINGSSVLGAGDLVIAPTTDASSLTTGTLPDARLSSNIPIIGTVSNGRYYRLNTYTKEPETFLPVTKAYDGVTITGANEVTYIDGVIYIKVGTLYYKKQFSEPINVKWFGAIGDWNGTTGTDNSSSFQTAIDIALTIGTNKIFIPLSAGERYYLATKVNITKGNFSIIGDATVQNFNNSSSLGGYITGPKTIGALFDYGNGLNVTTGALTVDGIAMFKIFSTDAGLIDSAILISMNNNGPHRNIYFRNCSAKGFDKVIYLNAPTAGYVGGGVILDNCNFVGNNYSVKADQTVYITKITGSQIEALGSISGKFDAGVTITDNIIESNSNTLNVDASSPNLIFENNYLEGNSGSYLVRFKGGNAFSTARIGSNFGVDDAVSDDIYLFEGFLTLNILSKIIKSSVSRRTPFTFKSCYLNPGTSLKGEPFYLISGFRFVGWLDPKEFPMNPHPSVTPVLRNNLGSDILETPFGTTQTGLTVGASSSTNDRALSISYTTSDTLLFTALVSVKNANNEIPSVYFFNQLDVAVESASSVRFQKTWDNDWYLFTASIKPLVAGTSLKVRFASDASTNVSPTSTLSIAAIGAYKTVAGDIDTYNSQARIFAKAFNPFRLSNNLQPIYKNRTQVLNTAATTTENTLLSFTIPAYSVGVNGGFWFMYVLGNITNNANAKTFRIKFNGTTINSINAASGASLKGLFTIGNRNSMTSQVSSAGASVGFVSGSAVQVTSIDTTTDITVTVTMQHTVGTDASALEDFQCFALP